MESFKKGLVFILLVVLMSFSPVFAGEKIVLKINDENLTKTDITNKEAMLKANIEKIVEIQQTKGETFTPNWTVITKVDCAYVRHLDFMIATTDAMIKNDKIAVNSGKNSSDKFLEKEKILLADIDKLKKENARLKVELNNKIKPDKSNYELQIKLANFEKKNILLQKENDSLKNHSTIVNTEKSIYNTILITILVLVIIGLIIAVIAISYDKKETNLALKDKTDTIKYQDKIIKEKEQSILSKNEEINELHRKVRNTNKLEKEFGESINSYNTVVNEYSKTQTQLEELKEKTNEYEKQINQQKTELAILTGKLSLKDGEILDKSNEILELKTELEKLKKNAYPDIEEDDSSKVIETKNGKVVQFQKKQSEAS